MHCLSDCLGFGLKYITVGKIGVAKLRGQGDFWLDEPGGLRNISSFGAFVVFERKNPDNSFSKFVFRVIVLVCNKTQMIIERQTKSRDVSKSWRKKYGYSVEPACKGHR